jgi:hypothetical protein
MKGGRFVGSGSDGCVFNSRFDASGNVIKGSEDGKEGIASKVYVAGPKGELNPQAVNEYAIMMRVRKATNGLGVAVALDGSLRAIPDIVEAERTSIPPPARGACAQLTDDAKPYTVIELPLVKGHMFPSPGGYPAKSFETLETAIQQIKAAKVTQLDLAVRNIFYVEDDKTGATVLLLGDFGNGIDLGSNDPNVLIKGFVRFIKHYKASAPATLVARDGVHYRAYLYMMASVFCLIATRKEAKDQQQKYWKDVQDVFTKFKGSFQETMASWRLMRMIDSVAPKPLNLSDIDSKELEEAFNELDKLGANPGAEQKEDKANGVPPAASGPPAASVPAGVEKKEEKPAKPAQAGEAGGVLPLSFEDVDDGDYGTMRELFITQWQEDIKRTCDELDSLGPDPKTVLDGLVLKTRDEVLRSDELMYEFLRAMFGEGSMNERLKRLIGAWFPGSVPAEGGARRRRTYRRKLGKRVKMSRRR